MEHIDFRELPSKDQEDIRRKAVQAVIGGIKQFQAAELFGVTRQAVCGWVKKYKDEGEEGLAAQRKGRPKGKKLNSWQCKEISKVVIERTPDQRKVPFWLWTREAVGKLIEQRFGLKLSAWKVGRYPADWGFTPQKPVKKAFERDPKAVEAWLKEEYPAIQARAKREKAEIYWGGGDEMGVRSDHVTGTTFGPRGQTPAVPSPTRLHKIFVEKSLFFITIEIPFYLISPTLLFVRLAVLSAYAVSRDSALLFIESFMKRCVFYATTGCSHELL